MNPFRPPRLPVRASLGLLPLRLLAGLAFVFHGWGKIQHPSGLTGWMGPDAGVPGFLQAAAAIAEFGGGIAWMLGLLTPIASLGLVCTMAVAVYVHAVVLKDPFVGQGPSGGSYEPASGYLCVALLLLLAGPGALSADRLLFGSPPAEPPPPKTA
jgi:putative oxidoreductase